MNKPIATFGVERLLRLFILLTGFFSPGLYVRHYSGKYGFLPRKLCVDYYVTLKVVVPIIVLCNGLDGFRMIQILVLLLGCETIHYNLNLLFLSDVYTVPVSNKRSYILTILNYIEICFDFAVLYKGTDSIHGINTVVDSLYFSFVTAFTVGDGEMNPTDDTGKALIVAQCLSLLVLVTLVFTKIVSGFNDRMSSEETGNLVKPEPQRDTLE